jgi:cytochrome c oxidase assembly factor CtaG
MEVIAVLIVLAVGLMLERDRLAPQSARAVVRRRR